MREFTANHAVIHYLFEVDSYRSLAVYGIGTVQRIADFYVKKAVDHLAYYILSRRPQYIVQDIAY